MWARIIILAAALGGGAALGRRALNRGIEKRLPAEIEQARERAIVELHRTISSVIRERLVAFTLGLSVKAGLVGAAYLTYVYGLVGPTGLKALVGALIAGFILYDVVRTAPYAAPAFRIVRRHNWRPRRAFVEFVAGVAFERAYAEAMVAVEKGDHRLFVALSKYSAHSLSTEVAEAVADVARSTTFQAARARATLAAALAGLMFAVYAGFLVITIGAVE